MRATCSGRGERLCECVDDHNFCRDILYDELYHFDELANKVILNRDVVLSVGGKRGLRERESALVVVENDRM